MEVAVKGAGELVIRLVNARGRTMMEQKIVASGSPTVQAKAIVPLEVETADGAVAVTPVLAHMSNPRQEVKFDGQQPARFSKTQCRRIGGSTHLALRVARGTAPALAPTELALPTPKVTPRRRSRTQRGGK